jgi:hypothetical protein
MQSGGSLPRSLLNYALGHSWWDLGDSSVVDYSLLSMLTHASSLRMRNIVLSVVNNACVYTIGMLAVAYIFIIAHVECI